MKIAVERRWLTPESTIGEMYIDGEFFCFTLEPPVMPVPVKPRAIPEGTYRLTLRESDKFKRILPHVENVPDFIGIMIHNGNVPADTEGCCLVGNSRGTNFIGNSKVTLLRLLMRLGFTGVVSAGEKLPEHVIRYYFEREETK